MTRDERVERAIHFFTEEFVVSIRGRGILPKLWPYTVGLTEGSDIHRPFGYTAPQYFTYDEAWAFFFCAEAVVDTTESLDDEEFETWLRYLRSHINAHTTMETSDEDTIQERVLSVMPEVHDLITKVFDYIFMGAS